MNEKMKETADCSGHTWIPLLGFDKEKIVVPTALFTCLKCGDLKVGTNTIKISRFRMDMGELPINSVAGINLKNPLSTNGTAAGLIITSSVVANSQGIGAPLYMDVNGDLREASATTSATSPCVALALDAELGLKRVLVQGILRKDAWAWVTGPGTASLIYVSTTTGALTQTKPSGADQVIQPVGWALGADYIYFSPSMMYLTHM